MNILILFESDRIESDLFEIKDPKRLFHLKEILRAKIGDQLKIGLLGGHFGSAQITSLTPMHLQVTWDFAKQNSPAAKLELCIGLSRPPTLKKVLEHATSMGVTHFNFYRATLSEKSYASSKVFEPEHLNELLIAGLSQAGHSLTLPEIEVSTYGVNTLNAHEQSFVLSLRSGKTLHDYDIDFEQPLSFVLGPERGLTEKEEDILINQGFKPLKIHENILRVEIASFALLGALQTVKYGKNQ